MSVESLFVMLTKRNGCDEIIMILVLPLILHKELRFFYIVGALFALTTSLGAQK